MELPEYDDPFSAMLLPDAEKVKVLREGRAGPVYLRLCTDIETQGLVEYRFLLYVFDLHTGEIRFVFSSERAKANKLLEPGSYFFCLFDGERHRNFGASPEWADLERFQNKAVELLKSLLHRYYRSKNTSTGPKT